MAPGMPVWRTKDPALESHLRASYEGLASSAMRGVAVDVCVEGKLGRPLVVTLRYRVSGEGDEMRGGGGGEGSRMWQGGGVGRAEDIVGGWKEMCVSRNLCFPSPVVWSHFPVTCAHIFAPPPFTLRDPFFPPAPPPLTHRDPSSLSPPPLPPLLQGP